MMRRIVAALKAGAAGHTLALNLDADLDFAQPDD